MYCHRRPPDAMPLLTFKCFWDPGHIQRPNFDGFIFIRYAAPPYLAHLPPVWQSLVRLHLLCATPGNEAKRRIYGGCMKTPVLF